MDEQTIAAYERDPASFAKEWSDQPPPDDLYELLRRYFRPGLTADVGCGSGRDAAWLAANGFEVVGFDASAHLLEEARSRYPSLDFRLAELPLLAGVERRCYENVLCETVLMHLEPPQIPLAVRSLTDLLRPGGTLYISWRVTLEASRRDELGRLYASFDESLVLKGLGSGFEVLFDEEVVSGSSGKVIHRLIGRRRTNVP